jgi:flagellar FliL protein
VSAPTKEKASTKGTADDAEEPKGGKKKLLLIGIVLVLLAAGAGAYFFLFAGSGDSTPAPPEAGAVVKLDPIAVNLAGGGYLKIGIALQMTADAASHEGKSPDGSKALDLVIKTYSQAQPTDVTANRDALKEHLEKEIEEAYEGDVMGIYLTQYVTQ